MAPRKLRQRLVEASLAGRYDIHLGVGLGLALLGLVLFPLALRGEGAARAWQMFHVNWIYFTGITGGSIAFAAVHKTVNARWSGMVIRFAEAVVAFAPVSLLGCVLVFTVGYPYIYGHMQEQLPALSHGKQVWLSHGAMFARVFIGLLVLYWLGWKLIRTDLVPDVFAAKGLATGGRRAMFERWTRKFDGSEGAIEQVEHRLRTLGPDLRDRLRPRVHDGGVRWHHGAAAALVLKPARRLVLHGLVPRRAHAARAEHDLWRQAPRGRRPDLRQAAARPGQALLRLHHLLDLPHVGAVPGDLVCQPAGGDRLRLRATLGSLDTGGARP